MAAKAQSKHENFVNKTSTAIGYTIIGLDYYIEDYEVTLRQAIMSIRSTTEPKYNLFTAVDDMSYSNKVVFAFRKSFEAEAAAAIPGLPNFEIWLSIFANDTQCHQPFLTKLHTITYIPQTQIQQSN